MKNWPNWIKRSIAALFTVLFCIGFIAYVRNNWTQFKSEKQFAIADMKSGAITLAGQLYEFGIEWSTNNPNTGKPQRYFWDQYNNEFQSRVMETVKGLGKHGKRSRDIDLSREFTEPQSVLKTSDEIRRMANELKE